MAERLRLNTMSLSKYEIKADDSKSFVPDHIASDRGYIPGGWGTPILSYSSMLVQWRKIWTLNAYLL